MKFIEFALYALESITGLALEWPNGTTHPPAVVVTHPGRVVACTCAAVSVALLVAAWLAK